MQPEFERDRILERLQHQLKVGTVRNHSTARRQRGLSIVELMVGIAVGLFIVAGTAKLFVDYLGSNRSLLLATRVNQDLRAAADLVVRDLRRAGYWENATKGISTNPTVAPVTNPYAAVAYASGTLTYSYSKDNDDLLDTATEAFGVRRGVDSVSGKGVLQMQTASLGVWQTITDPGTLDIPSTNGLTITPSTALVVELWDECPCIFELTCTKNQFKNPNPDTSAKGIYYDNRPRLSIRQYLLNIRAQASADATIVREIREKVRVRNDQLDGTCPP
jgi:prepilin peptidase dependent protein B